MGVKFIEGESMIQQPKIFIVNFIRHAMFIATVFLLALVPARAGTLMGSTIRICDDGAEWPPYSYYKRLDGRSTKDVVGFSVDVIASIFKKANLSFSIELLPWARCQAEVANGLKYQMTLAASYNEERAKTYHLSRAYYRTTNYYFYSRTAHPTGLKIDSVADLKKYKVCGLFGYNYETYGLPPGSVDQGTKNFSALTLKMLHADRCDLFLEKYEVMAGFAATGQDFLSDKNLGRAPVPGMAPTKFYMMISRQSEHASELLKLINDGLAEMESSGLLEEMRKKYIH